jgi:hypothetical protein
MRLNVLRMEAMQALALKCECPDKDHLMELKKYGVKMWLENCKKFSLPLIISIDNIEYELKHPPREGSES